MGYYRGQTTEKVYAEFTEKNESILDAEMTLAPHIDYLQGENYAIKGVGSMFEGVYRLRKVVLNIDPSGFSVSASARMVYDKFGNFVEDGYQDNEMPNRKTPAPVKTTPNRTYTVVKGDTLWGIAKRLTGNPYDWVEIEKENHNLLVSRDRRNATDAGRWIYPGQILVIPGRIL